MAHKASLEVILPATKKPMEPGEFQKTTLFNSKDEPVSIVFKTRASTYVFVKEGWPNRAPENIPADAKITYLPSLTRIDGILREIIVDVVGYTNEFAERMEGDKT